MTGTTTHKLADTNVKCRLVTDEVDWALLRSDWERLYELTPEVTPWQSWDFLSRWWQTQSGSRLLRIVMVECGGVVAMMLPLQLRVLAPLQLRVLEPLGMPDDINRPRLALGVPDAALFAAAMTSLWRRRHEWDALHVDEKPRDDMEILWLRDAARGTRSWLQQLPFHPCPHLKLSVPWRTYLESRSSGLLKNLRAARRCLEAKGIVTAQRFDAPADVMRAFDILLNLHKRSWKHTACVGLSQSEAYGDFYREFVAAVAQRQQARAWVLNCDSQPVAATIAFHEGSTYYSAQIAHDEAFSKCSPGTLLEFLELEDLMVEGRFSNYDFLGGALANKRRWTCEAHETERVLLTRRSWRGTAFQLYYFTIKPRIKRLQDRRVSSDNVTAVNQSN